MYLSGGRRSTNQGIWLKLGVEYKFLKYYMRMMRMVSIAHDYNDVNAWWEWMWWEWWDNNDENECDNNDENECDNNDENELMVIINSPFFFSIQRSWRLLRQSDALLRIFQTTTPLHRHRKTRRRRRWYLQEERAAPGTAPYGRKKTRSIRDKKAQAYLLFELTTSHIGYIITPVF